MSMCVGGAVLLQGVQWRGGGKGLKREGRVRGPSLTSDLLFWVCSRGACVRMWVCVCASILLCKARSPYFRKIVFIKKWFGWISRWRNISSCRFSVRSQLLRFIVFNLFLYESTCIWAVIYVPGACLTLTCPGTSLGQNAHTTHLHFR